VVRWLVLGTAMHNSAAFYLVLDFLNGIFRGLPSCFAGLSLYYITIDNGRDKCYLTKNLTT
jgi:hypothetical protein